MVLSALPTGFVKFFIMNEKILKQAERFKHIPLDLQQFPHWVGWNYEEQSGKPAKVLLNALTGKYAKVNDSTTWQTFDQAINFFTQRAPKFASGIGFVLNGEGYCCIDLDHCFQKGVLSPVARDILKLMNSYTEVSPSGQGLHIWIKGKKPVNSPCKAALGNMHIEVYDTGRYLTMTGEVFEGFKEIAERDLKPLFDRFFPAPSPAPKVEPKKAASPLGDTDDQILERMFNSQDGATARRLWQGNIEGYESASQADWALLRQIAFYAGNNPEQMERIFCQSGLYRQKTDTKRGNTTYLKRTIQKVIEHTAKTYDPNYRSKTPPPHPGDTPKDKKAPTLTPTQEKTLETVEQPDQEAQSLLEKKFRTVADIPFDLSAHHPFLQEYCRELHSCTDARPQALITALLSALAANVGNKAFIQCGHRKHFCNIWSIIIAPSTIGRKSTAIDLATSPLKDFNEELQKAYEEHRKAYEALPEAEKNTRPAPVKYYIKYPAASAEKFIEILGNNPNGILVFYEIATFLSRMNKSYNADVKSTITAMFDGSPFEASTLSRGDQYVKNPAFSIATASTKEWFLKEIDRENDTNSGFLQRFLICNANDIKLDSLDFGFRTGETVSQYVQNNLAFMYNALRGIGQDVPVEIALTEEAKALYSTEFRETMTPYFNEGKTALYSYIGRLFEDYFFRFSILFTLIDYIKAEEKPEKFIVTAENATYAHRLCHFYLKNIEYFLQNEITDNFETRDEKKIVRILREKQIWVKHTLLQNLTNLTKKAFDEAIQRLLDQEVIEQNRLKAKNNKVATYYRIILK